MSQKDAYYGHWTDGGDDASTVETKPEPEKQESDED